MNPLKKLLVEQIQNSLGEKMTAIKQNINSARESRDNETKSSVGDKYETSRAMMQMEVEKNQARLTDVESQLASLVKIDLQKKFKKAEFGSWVETSAGNYFISVAFGKANIQDISVYCISPFSPMGKALLGKRAGEKILFRGEEMIVHAIY
ncbi:MAG: GreA/GreB family elongation factor [Prolixibacteraceae bacterium]|nr:GreA/GreB family elongation factor [Prolixibacteraceae bacterium]